MQVFIDNLPVRPPNHKYWPSGLHPCIREQLAILVPSGGLRLWMERFPSVYTIHPSGRRDGKNWRFSARLITSGADQAGPAGDGPQEQAKGGWSGWGQSGGSADGLDNPPPAGDSRAFVEPAGPRGDGPQEQAEGGGSGWGQSGVSADGPGNLPPTDDWAFNNQRPIGPDLSPTAVAHYRRPIKPDLSPAADDYYSQGLSISQGSADGPRAPAARTYYSQVTWWEAIVNCFGLVVGCCCSSLMNGFSGN
jgi:hypothetical protein